MNLVGSLQSGIPTMDRNHEGHGGYAINDITSSVATWLQGSIPDVILLLIGINDLGGGATPSEALNRLSQLLDTIHAERPSARLVLATHPPVMPVSGVNPQDVVAYNAGMPALVNLRAGLGWNIELLDVYTLAGLSTASGSPDISPDGFHYTLTGYSKIANVWSLSAGPGDVLRHDAAHDTHRVDCHRDICFYRQSAMERLG